MPKDSSFYNNPVPTAGGNTLVAGRSSDIKAVSTDREDPTKTAPIRALRILANIGKDHEQAVIQFLIKHKIIKHAHKLKDASGNEVEGFFLMLNPFSKRHATLYNMPNTVLASDLEKKGYTVAAELHFSPPVASMIRNATTGHVSAKPQPKVSENKKAVLVQGAGGAETKPKSEQSEAAAPGQ